MVRKNVILYFSAELTDKPILSGMIREHEVSVNFLQASITPEEAGTMFIWLEGEADNVRHALEYLEQAGVRLVFPNKNLVWHEEKCTHCGACIGQCLPRALSMDPLTSLVTLAHETCIACELCIPACAYKALESLAESLGEAR
jgi:NAD-dependent dihydropyrimidine dehydrogenase PreA subunit